MPSTLIIDGSANGAESPDTKGDIVQPLVYSDNAIYQLRRLSQIVQEETGVRHRLSDPLSVMKLLRFSAASPVERIFEGFTCLLVELDSDQQAYLRSEGLLLPPVIMDKVRNVVERRQMTG